MPIAAVSAVRTWSAVMNASAGQTFRGDGAKTGLTVATWLPLGRIFSRALRSPAVSAPER
nr:hypothetical protein GCM10020093_061990 [Planobispora longispora]